ncbi:MAG: XdhC family protein [Paracoccaceae bacterium]|nr:XdhC/CoxI family protein [Rhodobacterales bacterium LSUCC0374]
MENMPELALEWHRAGRGAVLASVVETWGSAPRRVGSQLVVAGDGEMQGSVSGGCVEGAVVLEAQDMLGTHLTAPKLLEFGVSDDAAFAVGLACGGRIKILLQPIGGALPEAILQDLVAARAARNAVALISGVTGEAPPRVVERAEALDLSAAFANDKSGLDAEGLRYIAIHNPPLRMVVVGAVHIAQSLIPMAQMAGYDVTLVDPRPAFGSTARFESVRLLDAWPDEALDEIGLDARTAVVTLTHDPKLDDPAIMAALRADVFYLGCLGSTRTHAKRVDRLAEAGFGAEDIARIHAPIGLNIGAMGPAEIAISIMAQITERLRKS